eukprot:8843658-Pyramimonas_sp.AAC.1
MPQERVQMYLEKVERAKNTAGECSVQWCVDAQAQPLYIFTTRTHALYTISNITVVGSGATRRTLYPFTHCTP